MLYVPFNWTILLYSMSLKILPITGLLTRFGKLNTIISKLQETMPCACDPVVHILQTWSATTLFPNFSSYKTWNRMTNLSSEESLWVLNVRYGPQDKHVIHFMALDPAFFHLVHYLLNSDWLSNILKMVKKKKSHS